MKTLPLLAVVMTLVALPARADVEITGMAEPGTVTQLPGSPLDFDFVGGASAGSVGAQTDILTDFSVVTPTGNTGFGSNLLNPLGQNINTAVNYAYGSNYHTTSTAASIGQVTLGASLTFNYSNFYVYVLYGNGGNTVFDTSSIILTPNDYGYNADTSDSLSTIGGVQVSVTDDEVSDGDTGQIVAYHVTGETSGATLSLLVQSPNFGEIGAVSFSQTDLYAPSVPEPQAWTLLLGGLACILGWLRLKRTA